jgi:hypothetical protein
VKREVTQNTGRLADLFNVGLAAFAQPQVSLDREAPLLVEGTLEIAGCQFDQVDAVDPQPRSPRSACGLGWSGQPVPLPISLVSAISSGQSRQRRR